MKKCSIDGCGRKYYARGLCRMHYTRVIRHPLSPHLLNPDPLKPGAPIGALNRNWKGGISEYKEHGIMKKVRLQKLESENHLCQICHSEATEIHHLDRTKSNHDPLNLVAVCRPCHFAVFHKRTRCTSKYKRLYGKSLAEISRSLSMSIPSVWKLHKIGKLPNILAQ
jgi:hypothetical protein